MQHWSDTGDFIPRGFCLSWDPDLIAMIVLSNCLIALVYLIVTIALIILGAAPRPVVPRWLYWTYAGFIFCCGVSHVLDGVTVWLPFYRLQAAILGVTVFFSVIAAMLPIATLLKRESERRDR